LNLPRLPHLPAPHPYPVPRNCSIRSSHLSFALQGAWIYSS
jgi:hypothetical protein